MESIFLFIFQFLPIETSGDYSAFSAFPWRNGWVLERDVPLPPAAEELPGLLLQFGFERTQTLQLRRTLLNRKTWINTLSVLSAFFFLIAMHCLALRLESCPSYVAVWTGGHFNEKFEATADHLHFLPGLPLLLHDVLHGEDLDIHQHHRHRE